MCADHAHAVRVLRPTYSLEQRQSLVSPPDSTVRFAPSVGRQDDQETVPQAGLASNHSPRSEGLTVRAHDPHGD